VARPRPEKNSAEPRVLPMELHVGDRLTNETAEREIIGRPYTTNMGKNAHVRVRRGDQPEITEIRTWSAYERISVKRT
jgi:hypothetical protein